MAGHEAIERTFLSVPIQGLIAAIPKSNSPLISHVHDLYLSPQISKAPKMWSKRRLLLSLAKPSLTAAFPLYFPPAVFTNYTTLVTNQIPTLLQPSASIAWDPTTSSPSLVLCSSTNFAGTCWLLLGNAPETCLGLPAPGMSTAGLPMDVEVGSARVGGGAACVVYA